MLAPVPVVLVLRRWLFEMRRAFYNAGVQVASKVCLPITLLVALSGGALWAQESDAPPEGPAEAVESAEVATAETSPRVGSRLQQGLDRLTAAKAELEALEAAWLERDRVERSKSQESLEEFASLEAELAAAGKRTPKMDSLFGRVNPLVDWAAGEVRAALDRASRPSELPDWLDRAEEAEEAKPFGEVAADLPTSEALEQLEELLDAVREDGDRLRELELELRMADVKRDLDVASRIYRLRLATLDGLTFERRREVFSLADEGWEAVRLEARVLDLAFRLQWFQLRIVVASIALQVRSLFTAVIAGRVLVRLLIIVLLWRWVQRGRERFFRRWRRKAERIEDPRRQRWALRVADFTSAVAPWGVFIAAVWSLGWVFEREISEIPFFYASVALLITYGIYRLAVDLLVGAAVAGMESTGLELTKALRDKLFRAVRWVARAATPVGFVMWLYSYRLGGGVLYSKIRAAGLMIVGLVLLAVVLRFRQEIREMFLALRAHGRLADLVRSTERTWAGYVVTPVAFVWLCGRGALGVFRGLTNSFERTRTASSYLSRRRMLKVAERSGFAEGSIQDLPADLVAALDERLSIEDMEILGGFPGLETARASAGSWREIGTGGSLLLAGEDGLGKQPWLEKFLEVESNSTRLVLEERILSPARLRSWLADRLLGKGEHSLSQDDLVAAILDSPRRVVTLEGAENLFLATVNGYKALAELGPIIDATRKQIFWLLTMKGLAWNHLRAAGKDLAFLRRKFVLSPGSEEPIEALIDDRLARCGYEASFADLMAVEGRREDEVARNKLGKSTFMNLLWDFAGGNPQIALHFFLRSLEVTSGGRVKVRPFAAPQEADLSEAGDEALFLLAAVMRHNGLNVRQAATTTNYSVGSVEGLFLHLLDLGAVSEKDGIYCVTTSWRATILRVLRRRNVLVS